jgi:serine/threonine protein kinase
MLSHKPHTPYHNKDELGTKTRKNKFDLDLRIVDFGIFGSTQGLNPEKIQAGSLKYMSPELLTGHTESSPAIDIWSLGLMLHALVLGFLPFRSSNKDELKKMIIEQDLFKFNTTTTLNKLTASCKDLIKRMLHKDPSKRITLSEIMTHPWIARYKEQKIREEWGYPEESEGEEEIMI